jgi:hypothetical protein
MNELDAEGFLHGVDGAGEFDHAAFGTGSVSCDGETELSGEGVDEFDGGGVCGVETTILSPGEALFTETVGGSEGIFAFDDDGYGEAGGGGCGSFVSRLGEARLLASGQDDAGRCGEGSDFLFERQGRFLREVGWKSGPMRV